MFGRGGSMLVGWGIHERKASVSGQESHHVSLIVKHLCWRRRRRFWSHHHYNFSRLFCDRRLKKIIQRRDEVYVVKPTSTADVRGLGTGADAVLMGASHREPARLAEVGSLASCLSRVSLLSGRWPEVSFGLSSRETRSGSVGHLVLEASGIARFKDRGGCKA